MSTGSKNVAQMKPGEVAVIVGFNDGALAPKLLEMGFLPGSTVRFNFTAPFGDPVCVTVGAYDLSLRRQEASTISILG